jgi:hypothetical protein
MNLGSSCSRSRCSWGSSFSLFACDRSRCHSEGNSVRVEGPAFSVKGEFPRQLKPALQTSYAARLKRLRERSTTKTCRRRLRRPELKLWPTEPARGKIKSSSVRLKCLRENPCRPYGARVRFPLYPALKRWANLFRAYGAGFPAASSHCRCRNIVLTQTLKSCPDTKRVQTEFSRGL